MLRQAPYYGCPVEAANRLAEVIVARVARAGSHEAGDLQPLTIDIPLNQPLHKLTTVAFITIQNRALNQRFAELFRNDPCSLKGNYLQVEVGATISRHATDPHKQYPWRLDQGKRGKCSQVLCPFCYPNNGESKKRAKSIQEMEEAQTTKKSNQQPYEYNSRSRASKLHGPSNFHQRNSRSNSHKYSHEKFSSKPARFATPSRPSSFPWTHYLHL